METMPVGVFEGITALIWPLVTTRGIIFTIVPPCVAVIDTPPSVVDKGNDSEGLIAGPSDFPKIEKIDPWAMAPPGSPGVSKLAALTTPRVKMKGVWAYKDAAHKGIRAAKMRKLKLLRMLYPKVYRGWSALRLLLDDCPVAPPDFSPSTVQFLSLAI